jgi:hypothetical protein
VRSNWRVVAPAQVSRGTRGKRSAPQRCRPVVEGFCLACEPARMVLGTITQPTAHVPANPCFGRSSTAPLSLETSLVDCLPVLACLRAQGTAGQPKHTIGCRMRYPMLPWFTTCPHPCCAWQCRAADRLCLWPNLSCRPECPFWSR